MRIYATRRDPISDKAKTARFCRAVSFALQLRER
jgi:hypothetical protein